MVDWFLLRGLTREQRHWSDFPEQVSARFGGKALSLDFPGFGTERRRLPPVTIQGITDDLRRRLPRLGPGRPLGFVALSLGGMVALDWCARYPQDFAHLMLINTSAGDLSLPWRRMRLTTARDLARSWLRGDLVAREHAVLRTTSCSHADNRELAESWAAWAREDPAHPLGPAAQLVAAIGFRMPRLPRGGLEVPTVVVTSGGDRLCAPACGAAIAKRLAAPLRHHPWAGHDVSLDDPAWVLDEMERLAAGEAKR